MGFGLCVSALVLYLIEQWKTQTLGADQFVEFILTRERMKQGMKLKVLIFRLQIRLLLEDLQPTAMLM